MVALQLEVFQMVCKICRALEIWVVAKCIHRVVDSIVHKVVRCQ